jgi:hypothetical protein
MIKLLILGSGNVNPINFLSHDLKQYSSFSYQIDGLNLYRKGTNGVVQDYKYLDNIYEIVQKEQHLHIPCKIKVKEVLKIIFSKHSIKKPSDIISRIKNHLELYKINLSKKRYLDDTISFISNYDVVNVHWLDKAQAEITSLIPPTINVSIALWGSDLMDRAGKEIYALQYDALNRANSIIVTGQEMEEIVLAKFGRHLKPKIHHAIFGLEKEYFDQLTIGRNNLKETGISYFKQKGYDLNNYHYIVKVGYNAVETQNHISILNEISQLNKELLNKCFFIIPMTYGPCSNTYKEEVEHLLTRLNFNGTVIKDYLTDTQSKSISAVCNLMVNLRENDALNNSMLESLIAGAVVLNGLWLPYKTLKLRDIHYIEVPSLCRLLAVFSSTIYDFESHLEKAKNNADKLDGYICGKENILKWEKAFAIEK